MIEQVPVQATYLPIEDELTLAWYLALGSILYALQVAPKWRNWRPIAISCVCAAIGYAGAVEALEYAVKGGEWWCKIAEFPNLFGAGVGYLSHNLPALFELASKRVVK